jgi:hypothetical protein
MPDSQPWTQGEIIRHVVTFGKTLERIEAKLDTRPDWDDINRITENQTRVDTKQDEAIKKLEDRGVQFLVLGLGSILSAGSAIVVSLVTR